MVEKRGLGRGLSALLGDVDEAKVVAGAPAEEISGVREIPIELIHRNEHQPRWVFTEAEVEVTTSMSVYTAMTIEETRDANAALLLLMRVADARHEKAIRRHCKAA